MSRSTSTHRSSAHSSSHTRSLTSAGSRSSGRVTTPSGLLRSGADRAAAALAAFGLWDLTVIDRLQAPLTHYHE